MHMYKSSATSKALCQARQHAAALKLPYNGFSFLHTFPVSGNMYVHL